jgi:hypothetical protein
VADLYLGDRLKPSEPKATHVLTSAEEGRVIGMWASDSNGVATTITRGDHGLLLGRFPLLAQSAMRFLTPGGDEWQLDARGIRHTDLYGSVEELGRAQPAAYTEEQLTALAGTYVSDEAETTLTAAIENHALVLKRRPDVTIKLTPTYGRAFTADHGLGTVIFDVDSNHRVSQLRVVEDRVWNLPFRKLEVRSEN